MLGHRGVPAFECRCGVVSVDQVVCLQATSDYIRSDNGSEFTAKTVREWLSRLGVKTLSIEPGSPWENGYNESFNRKFRDELLNSEIFYTLKDAPIPIEPWRQEYDTISQSTNPDYEVHDNGDFKGSDKP
jgi:transposase InsO family protein